MERTLMTKWKVNAVAYFDKAKAIIKSKEFLEFDYY